MQQNFLTYSLCVLAAKKEFNEECMAYYEKDSRKKSHMLVIIYNNRALTSEQKKRPLLYKTSCTNKELPQWAVSAPTYTDIINWLDNTYRIRVYTRPTTSGHFTYGIYEWLGGAEGWEQTTSLINKKFYTDKEALEKGIEEALNMI